MMEAQFGQLSDGGLCEQFGECEVDPLDLRERVLDTSDGVPPRRSSYRVLRRIDVEDLLEDLGQSLFLGSFGLDVLLFELWSVSGLWCGESVGGRSCRWLSVAAPPVV